MKFGQETIDAIVRNADESRDRQNEMAASSGLPTAVARDVQALARSFHSSLFAIGFAQALVGKDKDCVAVVRLARDLLVTELDALLVSMEIASPEVKQ